MLERLQAKELLLFVASTLTAAGAVVIQTEVWQGVALLLIGGAVFVGRGFYKRFLKKKD